ncbi:ClpP/crotonase-like domain-containing protein [Thamnidium elegans]|nr:ClpP/crotonase-like domain-containing protein [Thamnidium elegans]
MTTYPSGRQELEYFVDIYFKMTYMIGTMKVPFISFMDGLTGIGSACSFSALSHFSIATENTKISIPETQIGHFCDAGSNFFLPRLNGNIGRYLALTAKTLMAEDVLFSGLATHFVDSSQLPYIKQSLIDLDNPSYNNISEVIERYSVKPDHIPTSYTLHGERRKIIDSCFQFDTVVEILEALQKEGSTFSLETINQINRGSPISVALTLEQLRRGSKLSLAQCLIMENKSWKVGPFDSDFREGVYSTMGKERAPQWSRTNYFAVDFKKDIMDRYINADIKQTLYLEGDKREFYFNAPYRGRGLPTEEEMKQVKYESNLITNEAVIAWFIDRYNNKYGVRQEVEEILKKYHNL